MLTKPNFLAKKIVMVHINKGEKLSFANDNLVVKEKSGKTLIQYTCHRIFIIYIVGGFTITTGLVERGRNYGISFVFLKPSYKFYASIPYESRGNTQLVGKQYTTDISMPIAQQLVKTKLTNQRKLVAQLRLSKEVISSLDELILKLDEPVANLATLMGIEGTGAKIYFKEVFGTLGWQGRQPRVKRDIINLLLDIGYTILFNYIDAMTSIYGFDTYKGNLHQEFYARKSLICDLVEPFRVIIDKKIRKMYNLGQVSEENFICINGRYNINYKSKFHYGGELAKEVNQHSACIFDYMQAYYRWFMTSTDVKLMPAGRIYKNDTN